MAGVEVGVIIEDGVEVGVVTVDGVADGVITEDGVVIEDNTVLNQQGLLTYTEPVYSVREQDAAGGVLCPHTVYF